MCADIYINDCRVANEAVYSASFATFFFIPLGRTIYGFTDMYLQQNTYISVLRKTQNYDTFVH